MPEYTVLSAISVVVVFLLDLRLWRTRVTAQLQFWLAMALVFFFQALVDGWLTKLSAPIVLYAPEHMLGLRWPFDIPVEDFAFGFSMLTLTLMLWVRLTARNHRDDVTLTPGKSRR